jgi:hypothetical protein
MNSSKVDSRLFKKQMKELTTPKAQTLTAYLNWMTDEDEPLRPTALCFRDVHNGGRVRKIKGLSKLARGFDAELKRSVK